MASNIVPDTIDDTYPVAGQDNNSQGFRDNFNIIKTNFTAAKSEIETLQNNTAKTNADNVFFENTLSRYTKLQETTTHVGPTNVSSPTPLSFDAGHFYTIVASNDVTLTLEDWPTNNEYAEMLIQVYGDGAVNRTVTFASTYSAGASQMRVDTKDELISSTTMVAGVSYTIAAPGTSDFTSVGAPNNNPGTTFTATAGVSGTGIVIQNSWSGAAITTNTVVTRSHLVKAFTYDNGTNVFLQYLGTFANV